VRAYIRGRMTFVVAVAVVVCLAAALTVSVAEETGKAPAEDAGGNSKCYVCHATLKTEDITVAHLEMDITCDQCHGPSIEHMHDEMLMTEPDLLFGRSEVRKMCSDPSCHAPGEGRTEYGLQDHKDPAKVQEFHDEWLGRTRPNGRAIMKNPVCTDCHGTHNLDEPLRGDEEQESEWVALLNGTDLTGWNAADARDWSVRRGRLIGKLAPGAKPVSLLTTGRFDNYLLAVTFRADWPAPTGPCAPGSGFATTPMRPARAWRYSTAKSRAPSPGASLWSVKGSRWPASSVTSPTARAGTRFRSRSRDPGTLRATPRPKPRSRSAKFSSGSSRNRRRTQMRRQRQTDLPDRPDGSVRRLWGSRFHQRLAAAGTVFRSFSRMASFAHTDRQMPHP